MLKQMFAAAPCRATPDFSPTANPFILTIDFSKTAIGAVLSQEQNNVERFLGVKGRKCRSYESNYHSSKGELLVLLYGLTKFEPLLRLNQFIVITDSTTVLHWSTMKDSGGTIRRWLDFIQQFDFTVMHRAGKTNINADLISRATHMDEPPPSDKDSITQGNQDMFPLPWKNLQIGKKPSLIEMNQETMSKVNNCSGSKYLPPSCQGKICTIVQPPWHLSGARADESSGPSLIGNFQGKIVIDQVDLEKAQTEDSAIQMVRSWFNLKTGKIDENKIDTSTFNEVHEDVLQLYKVRKQLRLTDEKTTSSSRLVYLLENEFEANPLVRIVVPPSHRYQALLAVHVREHWGVQRTTQQVRQHFFWPGWRADTARICKRMPRLFT